MQLAGMTPMQVIVAATKNSAHVSNLGNELGTIEANKIADIVVLNSDPLSDLKNLKDIAMVVHNGIIIRNELH